MNRSPYRNPLDICNSVDYEAMKKNGWRDQGIVVVDIKDPRINWADREILQGIAEKLYGKRRESES